MKYAVTAMTAIFILSAHIAYAEATEVDIAPAYEEYPQALGFQYGEISATGLSYQKWNEGTGVQITAGAVYIPYDDEDFYGWSATTLDYNIGTEAQFRVYGEDFAQWLSGQLYLFAGLKHRGYIPVEQVSAGYTDENDDWVDPVYEVGSYNPVLGLGVGIGIEIILFRHFSIPVELGYIADWNPSVADIAGQFEIGLRPQVGFRYRY